MKHYKLIITILCILLVGCETTDYQLRLYSAWCKANNRNDISFEEFRILRNEDMLPGTDRALIEAKKAKNAANLAATMAIINKH